MSVPEMAIASLAALMVVFAVLRLFLALQNRRRRCDIGSCKTIGSREIQEDFYKIVKTENGLLAVLADGMGKKLGGKIAARKVTEVFGELFSEYNALDHPFYYFQKAFMAANREVLKLLGDGRGSASASAVMLQENSGTGNYPTLYYAIVGNVKIAVFRNGELVPVGSGHTVNVLAEDRYYAGSLAREDALALLKEKRVYNYIGRDGFKDIEVYDMPIRLKKDDIVALMSDGVYEGMEWKELEAYLSVKASCRQKAFQIIEHINRKPGNKDNACIVLIKAGELL